MKAAGSIIKIGNLNVGEFSYTDVQQAIHLSASPGVRRAMHLAVSAQASPA